KILFNPLFKEWKSYLINRMLLPDVQRLVFHMLLLADALNLPMVYVRSDRKSHGKENQIEGHFNKGDKIVVIEDLISTGGSAIDAALALREAGAEVTDVLAIFTYGLERATNNFS